MKIFVKRDDGQIEVGAKKALLPIHKHAERRAVVGQGNSSSSSHHRQGLRGRAERERNRPVGQRGVDENFATAPRISTEPTFHCSFNDALYLLNGHGTHVAGTVAAIDNGIGVVGVAPGTTVVAVKVLDRRGSGSYSGVIAGIDYVAANGSNGDVANMSLGGGYSAELNAAVEAAAATGVKFVLAAGNESTDAATKSPASANGPNVYTISSFAQGDNWSSFSNYGNPPVDFAEPGSAILSTYKDGGYATLSGTSMASPHAAGILLLGGIRAGGTVSGDPDGNPDTIGVR